MPLNGKGKGQGLCYGAQMRDGQKNNGLLRVLFEADNPLF
jgi:hypothetical protein